MKHPVAIALLATCLSIGSSAAFSWSGPQVSLDNKNGRKVIKICDQGGGCTQSTPFFLALNSNAPRIRDSGDWSQFMYQARLHLTYVANSNGVAPLLQVHVRNTNPQFLSRLASQLNQLTPRPYVYIRLDLRDAPASIPGLEPVMMRNLQGDTVDNPANNVGSVFGQGSNWAFNNTWLTHEESEIARVLNQLDGEYPNRIMGLNVAYEVAGEWFYRPHAYDASQGKMLPPGTNGLFPWSNDEGTAAGPIGRHQFYLNDYSPTTRLGFCAWQALPAVLRSPCVEASTVERNNASPSGPFPEFGRARGVFLDPSDVGSLRAAYYNRYISKQKVDAIIRLLTHAKQLTGHRILTSVFYGYIYSMHTEGPTSGHTALSQLLASSNVDLVIGPYSYEASRFLGNPVVPHAPSDAPRLGNKLWIDEDDTRTLFAPPSAGFKTVTTLWDSIRVLRRNVLMAGLHGRGSHFFDLGDGWFGRTDATSDSEALWANLQSAFAAVNKLQLNAPNRFEAQVAVFTDDLSPAYVAGLTPAGEKTFEFSRDVSSDVIQKLGRLGTPVKQYLLSDLLRANLDLSAIRFAIFSNAWNVPDNLRQAIAAKLKTPGRTLLFIYASGYLNQDAAASVNNIRSLTGIDVVAGIGTPTLTQSFNLNGQIVAGGSDYRLTPWFRVSDVAATALGTYTLTSGVSAAAKLIAVGGGSYKSVYAAAPNVPLELLRRLSEEAGVHHFVEAGDAVEAAGNLLVVHTGTSAAKTISWPGTRPRIFETALPSADALLCRFCQVATQQVFNAGDTRVYRWTSAPTGNFELISGPATLEGWAVDFDVPNTPVEIHVYRGGPFGVGTFFTSFIASRPRPDLTIAFGIQGNNGFNINIGSCPSGTPLYAYAIDPELENGDSNSLIGAHTCP